MWLATLGQILNCGLVPTENLPIPAENICPTKFTDCSFILAVLSLKTTRNSLDSMPSSLLHETAGRFLSLCYLFNHKRNKEEICYLTHLICKCVHMWMQLVWSHSADASARQPASPTCPKVILGFYGSIEKPQTLQDPQLLDFDQLRNSLSN